MIFQTNSKSQAILSTVLLLF